MILNIIASFFLLIAITIWGYSLYNIREFSSIKRACILQTITAMCGFVFIVDSLSKTLMAIAVALCFATILNCLEYLIRSNVCHD